MTRRWVLVAAGTAALVGAAAITLPATAAADPADLRGRILAGVPPHVGYAVSTGRLGLPDIPALEQVTALFADVTRLRVQYASADRWRTDELTPAGERDTYHFGSTEYLWDFGSNQLTRVVGEAPVRLPRAGDLVPSELARRLVSLTRADPVSAIPARRVAGFDAAGFRITPADPDTTVGRIDVWCDPASGLPLRVEIAARGDELPLLFTEFEEITLTTPDIAVPTAPAGAGEVTAEAADLAGALRQLDAAPPPRRLAGRDLVPLTGALPGVGVYGSGVSGFVLVPATRGIADRVIDGAPAAGGVTVDVPFGRAARLTTPLLTVVARGGVRRGGILLAGTVAPAVLEQAVRELPGPRA
ncbi:hypothetical protein [Pseudonocardia ailaonensis]|uniref:hypothetical protein n=1 Tax=Pseudonocardia ailaonensis TaxID=367279 RepID=UPI0031DBFE0E